MLETAGPSWSPTELANVLALQEATNHIAYLVPTTTGLRKSIMDAVAPVREFLRSERIHDYAVQDQGESARVRLPALIVTDDRVVETVVSLYRPTTKHGDPRIWFSRLGDYVSAGDRLAVFVLNNRLTVLDVTTSPLAADLAAGRSSGVTQLLGGIKQIDQTNAVELLAMIESIVANGPLPAVGHGATAIGRTLETALGIKINSSKDPDWRTIEIKAHRSDRANRRTLFAQVPDWRLSGAKSSRDILRQFGYARPGSDLKLYVEVSARVRNSRGLALRIDSRADTLIEDSVDAQMAIVAVWPLGLLRNRLREKHAETFWVAAESTFAGGLESFRYTRIEHTRAPVVAQLEPLIEAGHITLDHLIKDVGGRVVEKGPLFKVDEEGFKLLFPPARIYTLGAVTLPSSDTSRSLPRKAD